MSEAITPSWSQFVKAHRAAAAARDNRHDEAERIACASFDWIGVPASGLADGTIGALDHHRHDVRGRRRIDPCSPEE